ncbi:acid-resistance membrane protein [Enterococcus sp. DIV0755b]|uniref:HdeD family acid-resistance protein n=1 Tax=Enterococcus sp. DIV0755b TaxID=2774657 RepID=UPI003F27D798
MEKRGFDWGSLILGILFVIVALMSFQDPVGDLVAIVIVFGVFAILKGIFEIFLRNRFKDLTGYKAKMPLVVGILDIIIGIFLLWNMNASVLALPFVFAIWFIVDSIFGLFNLDLARQHSNGYFWFSLIIDILGIIVGFILLFNPISSALTLSFLVGFYFMMWGITQIVYAFRK